MRGFISGAFWGTVLGGIVLMLVSLISEVPGQRPPQAAVETPPIEIVPVTPGTGGVEPLAADISGARAVDPGQTSAPTGGVAVLGPDVTTSAPQPTVDLQGDFLAALSTQLGGSETITIAPEAPVYPNPQAAVPAAPIVVTQESGEDEVSFIERLASGVIETQGFQPQTSETEDIPDLTPAIIAFGKTIQVSADKPYMALLLLDDPTGDFGPNDMLDLPFEATVALDPTLPGATARMQAYRDVGVEVAILLPAGGDGLAAALAAVPQAASVFDPSNRTARDGDILGILSETGHGLLVPNNAPEGLPAAAITLDLDSNNQAGPVMRRFLDQTAFNARSEPQVILGRMQAETFTALLIWGNQRRAQTLNLVPVSMILNQ